MVINWLFAILLAVIIELITVITRFGFKLKAKPLKEKIGFPVKFHHLYLGIFILVVGLFYNITLFSLFGGIALFEIGFGIAFSDVLHHFVVLKLAIGKTEFP
tara:strand:+ start:488 stop:793 length:306 start_codon:yes stop_codon:yes gene_type:complete